MPLREPGIPLTFPLAEIEQVSHYCRANVHLTPPRLPFGDVTAGRRRASGAAAKADRLAWRQERLEPSYAMNFQAGPYA